MKEIDLIKKYANEFGINEDEYINIMNQKAIESSFIDDIDVEEEMKKSSNALRIMTGIPEIDDLTNGLCAGIHVIAGFRKCCKSTLALNLIYRALNEGKNVCLLSLEMSKIDVLNILLSLHSFECNPETAVTREELINLYELDREKYNEILYSFLSLPGSLVICTEKDLQINNENQPIYSEENLDRVFTYINSISYKKTKQPIRVLVVDNINCIRVWDKKIMGEMAYSKASNYFRRISLNFGKNTCDEECNIKYGNEPVILLLLAQVNRSGGKEALYSGFYSESSIAETVNIERDATTIIPIYVNSESISYGTAYIKLEASRYCQSMTYPVTIPINLQYGKIGYPLEKINTNSQKLKDIMISKKFKLIYVEKDYEVNKILLPIGKELPEGFKEISKEEYYEI